MTEDKGRRTQIVSIAGRNIVVRELVDMQLMHLSRYAAILDNSNVELPEKMIAVERMLKILHTIVVQDSDREFLIEAEENGDVELSDLIGFVDAFQDEPAEKKPTVTRARGARAKR